jgi:hypothetical protein
MKLSTVLNRENRGVVATILVVLVLVPPAISIAGFAWNAGATEVFLEAPDPLHESCVRETSYMRFYHMDLLKEIREDVIRRGIRDEGITLGGCGDCHVNRAYFCNRCHEAVSLYPDCYGCHYYPELASEREEPGG